MRTLTMIAFLAILSIPAPAQAQDSTRSAEEIVSQAEAAFRAGVANKTRILVARKHFSDATNAYLELHRRGIRNPDLYLNLGNAATLADRWPEAIWAYHVGLKLDRNHAALREHLAFVRGKVLYPASGQGRLDADSWPTWLHRPTVGKLSCILIITYLAAWIGGTGVFLTRNLRALRFTIVAIVLATAVGAGLWHELRQARIDRHTPLVVVAHNTEFYRGNGAGYPQHTDMPMLPRGLEARQLHRRGAWLQIRVTTGEIGWVPLERVLVVEP